MATTSLWHIKGRLKDLIDYVENPEKTAAKTPELQDLYNVFSYVQRPEATQEGEYVTAINCLKETALRQMVLTKKRYGKTDGYIAWHGYQSFKPEEVTPQLAHEIGVKLAKEMWGDRFEIIVTTHLDKEHLHCHFCFNSVSFRDGGKYNYSKTEQRRLREASDRLCREYGLSVIEKPHKAPSRPVWLDEKNGKPTRYNVYRADVREAIDFSRTPYLEAETDKTESLQRFIQKVKQITELKALTPELIHEFVDKIVVYAPRYLDGKRVQLLDIYYSGVGILHELNPEEMEEAFQHHLAERNKEKTA